jgi:hypothetical protein
LGTRNGRDVSNKDVPGVTHSWLVGGGQGAVVHEVTCGDVSEGEGNVERLLRSRFGRQLQRGKREREVVSLRVPKEKCGREWLSAG